MFSQKILSSTRLGQFCLGFQVFLISLSFQQRSFCFFYLHRLPNFLCPPFRVPLDDPDWTMNSQLGHSSFLVITVILHFLCDSASKESACNAGDLGWEDLSWEDALKKRKATHSSILAWWIPWTTWVCKESDTTEPLLVTVIFNLRKPPGWTLVC